MKAAGLALFATLATLACARGAPPATVPAPVPVVRSDVAPVTSPGSTLPPALRVGADPAALQAIARASGQGSRLREDAQYLTDVVGPRLTGSSGLKRATDWALTRFRAHGADSAWLEPWRFGMAWERGPIALTLLAPHRRQLHGASFAWAPGTEGPVAGDVVFVDAVSIDEFTRRFAGRLAGAWAMIVPPQPRRNPADPALTARDSAALDSARHAYYAPAATSDEAALRRSMFALLADAGALGIIGDGEKDYGLLRTSGSPARPFPIPYVVVAHDTYAQLHRLVRAGERVTLRADIHNTLARDSSTVHNVVAELRGTDRRGEVVVVGAHLDSWDLGTGATDNAAGVVALLEAVRVLAASDVRPRRTIRFILFSGEEQGLLGSTAYVRAHRDELAGVQAVLILDNGTGRITGMSVSPADDATALWESLLSAISDRGPFTVQRRNKGGTDHRPFVEAGVPGFSYDQASRGYDLSWHSQLDTFDALVPADLEQAAFVIAVTAYELANLPGLLPRVATP